MEEQKKHDGAEKKHSNHSGRRHGYFIEPPKSKQPSADASAPQRPHADQQDKANGGEGAHAHKKNRHRRGRQHSKPHNQAEEAALNNKPQDTAPSVDADKNADSKKHGDNKNKNHNSHKNHKNSRNRKHDGKVSADTPDNNATERKDVRDNKDVKDKRNTPDTFIAPRTAPAHQSDEYEEYKLVFDDDNVYSANGEPVEAPKTEVVGIRFKSTGKVYYFDPAGKTYSKGSGVIVDTARGQEFGEVAMTNNLVNSSDIVPPLRAVIRAATDADVAHNAENKQKEKDAFKICTEKIAAHKLEMKLIDAQYTFDNSKLLFYFTSADRVDFRNLVKDLASVFRTRIELRQIGIRDEAKLIGGLGMCGRPLCCTIFLSDFDQVSIKMAKEQNLSLNSAKISGICGRLMCCLRYEHEAYEYEIKRTPPVDSLVRTENGDGVVTEINPLQHTIKVRLLASPEIPPKTYNRDDVTMLRKKQVKEEN